MSTTAPQAAQQVPEAGTPVGTVHVFDPHPLNWLFITWNSSRGTRSWDCCALTVIHVPESERK